jgi:hypothetical protein
VENEACVALAGPGPVAVSDGPGDYADDMECAWNITSPGPITIVFKAFATEECCDFLTISDGQSGNVLGSFSGEASCVRTRVSNPVSTR